MGDSKVTACFKRVKNVLSPEPINTLGRDVDWCQRQRRITPWCVVLTLLSGLATQNIRTLADLLRLHNSLFGTAESIKAFHKQLAKPHFGEFMRQVADKALHDWIGRELQAHPGGPFSEFQQIAIQDGSSFRVKDGLADNYPGRFNTTAPAAVELQTTLDLYSGTPSYIALTPDTEGERDSLPAPETLTHCLLLADRGYFQTDYMARLTRHQASFVIRAPVAINPRITAAYTGQGQSRPQTIGRHLKTVRLPKVGTMDLEVRWGEGKDAVVMRLVISWNRKKGQFTMLATNLSRARYSATQVKKAYQLRWQIELLFKEYKSLTNLGRFDTENPEIAEGMVWAAIAAATLKRFVAHAAQLRHAVEISTQKVGLCAGPVLHELFKALAARHLQRQKRAIKEILAYLATNAQRSHPERDRRQGRSQVGVEPAGVGA